MPLSSDIAQGNTRRLTGKKAPAKLAAWMRVLPQPQCDLGFTRIRSAVSNLSTAPGDASPSPSACENTTHHRVTDHEEFRL